MTENNKIRYNKGCKKDIEKPVKCTCGKVIAYQKNGVIYIKCRGCKREIAVARAESL